MLFRLKKKNKKKKTLNFTFYNTVGSSQLEQHRTSPPTKKKWF